MLHRKIGYGGWRNRNMHFKDGDDRFTDFNKFRIETKTGYIDNELLMQLRLGWGFGIVCLRRENDT